MQYPDSGSQLAPFSQSHFLWQEGPQFPEEQVAAQFLPPYPASHEHSFGAMHLPFLQGGSQSAENEKSSRKNYDEEFWTSF